MPNQGLASEIVTEALAHNGYLVEFSYRTWKRALIEAQNGDWDGLMDAYYTEERAVVFAYPDPILRVQVVFFARTDSGIRYRTLSDLRPYVIGVINGGVLAEELNASQIRVEEVTAIDQNIKMLLAKRIDLAINTKMPWLEVMRKFTPDEQAQITALEPPYSENKLYVIFSKQRTGWQGLTADFNRGLQAIKANGKYQTILEKHDMAMK